MYCSICGNALSPHLNYCSNCGARNAKEQSENSRTVSGWVAFSGAMLGAFGLLFGYNFLRILLDSRLETPAIVIIVIAYFCMMLGMFSGFLRYMTKGGKESKQQYYELPQQQTATYAPPPASFRSVNTAQLEPAGEPGSITEHTTRTLDEVLVERK